MAPSSLNALLTLHKRKRELRRISRCFLGIGRRKSFIGERACCSNCADRYYNPRRRTSSCKRNQPWITLKFLYFRHRTPPRKLEMEVPKKNNRQKKTKDPKAQGNFEETKDTREDTRYLTRSLNHSLNSTVTHFSVILMFSPHRTRLFSWMRLLR